MKAIFISVALLVSFVNRDSAAVGPPHRPTETTLKAALRIPVASAGAQSGWIAVPSGSTATVEHVLKDKLMIAFAGTETWVKRSDTDFDQRLAAFKTNQKQVQHEKVTQEAVSEQKQKVAAADFQKQHASYKNPLDRGAYDQTRSVVDYYDWQGRRYHIGAYGQRIYQ